MANNREIAQKVCDKILEEIKKTGCLPWVKPWSMDKNTVRVVDGWTTITLQPVAWNRSGKPYRGVNTYLPVGEYITFNQCRKEGGKLRKGAKGYPVIYWNFIRKEEADADTGEIKTKTIPVLKCFTVFHIEDCEGLKQKHQPKPQEFQIEKVHYEPIDGNNLEMNDVAEQIIASYVNRAGNGFRMLREQISNEAFYSPALDYVSVPNRSQFAECAEYYSTIFHELGHSTGHETRLNRFQGEAKNARFGSTEYSKEELVAEITAASVLNSIGLESGNSFRNSSAYIKSWSEKIKSDPLLYVTAANKAQNAFDLIVGIEQEKEVIEQE